MRSVREMPWFNVELEEGLSREFKSKVIREYGQLRGNTKKAFAEAVRAWVKEEVE